MNPYDTAIQNAYAASIVPALEHYYCNENAAEHLELGTRAYIHFTEEDEFGPLWWELR